jgi:uncharacterized protein (DUF433 family)
VNVSEPRSYVRTDERGVWRIGQTRVSLDSVVIAYQQGHSAETIRQQYPALTLEQVYGAITFYLANREDVERYLDQQQQLWNDLRDKASQNPSPIVERLRSLREGTALLQTLPSRR